MVIVKSLLTMIGGLALLIYGMKMLSSNLRKLTGGKLEQILVNATNNPIKGLAVGFLITVMSQSSATTTVLVVGLVNSEILIWLPNSITEITGNPKNIGEKIVFGFDIEENSYLVDYFANNNLNDRLSIVDKNEVKRKFDKSIMLMPFEIKDRIIPSKIFYIPNLPRKEELKAIELQNPVIICSRAFESESIKNIYFKGEYSGLLTTTLRVIHEKAFLNCSNLEYVEIPLGTKAIGARAFKGCNNLKYLSIPNTVENIGDSILDINSSTIVYCSPNSIAAKYCKEHNISMRDEGALELQKAKNLVANAVNQDSMREAIHLYFDAMGLGNLDAYYELGQCYLSGIGLDQDIYNGVQYLKAAARFGHKQSALKLYQIYSQGMEEIDKSKLEATIWLKASGETAESIEELMMNNSNVHKPDIETPKQQTIESVSNFADVLKYVDQLNEKYQLSKVYFLNKSDKGIKKIENAVAEYAPEAKNETVIFVFDDTLFGSGKDGFLVTNKAIYIHNAFKDSQSILWKDVKIFELNKVKSSYEIWINGNIFAQMTAYRDEDAKKLLELMKNIKNTMKF